MKQRKVYYVSATEFRTALVPPTNERRAMDEVFDYVAEMERSAEAVRVVAALHTADMEPQLARAVILCAPYVRFPDAGIPRLRPDYLAGMEYGGYHGFGYDRIQDECEAIACWYFDEIIALANT